MKAERGELLSMLLMDRTTGQNIIWATDDYGFDAQTQMLPAHMFGEYSRRILPRTMKARGNQQERTRRNAEVFTPSWVCNEQNNLIDDAWFGRKGVFNIEKDKGWETVSAPVVFASETPEKGWKRYVDARRMEIACGEAPYLVSRYDTVTGETIEVSDRIGLLDRKLRVVTENAADETEWLQWAARAYQSVYAYEFQGDSLLLARVNLLLSFTEHLAHAWGREPTHRELIKIATIVSWNVWQMDGLTLMPPYSEPDEEPTLLNPNPATSLCRVKDWRAKKVVTSASLIGGRRNGRSVRGNIRV